MSQPVDFMNIRLGITHEPGTLRVSQGRMQWTNARRSDHKISFRPDEVKNLEWVALTKSQFMLKVVQVDKKKPSVRFIGFPERREHDVRLACENMFGREVTARAVNTDGCNWGHFMLRSSELLARTEEKEILFSIPYSAIAQTVIQGRGELSIEFKEQPNAKNDHDQLVEMRIFVPDDDKDDTPAHEEFHSMLVRKARLEVERDSMVADFTQVQFKLPRGRYRVQFFPEFFMIRSDTFSYKIEYSNVKRLFILEQPNNTTSLLVSLQPPIRQGQTTYGFIIMEFPNDEQCTANINATEEELTTKYASKNGDQLLDTTMEGSTFDIISRLYMALSKVKIIASRGFKSKDEYACIDCSQGANKGFLYPLERSFFFIYKPCTYFKHADIHSVEFLRIQEKSKMFDLKVTLNSKKRNAALTFTNIDKTEYNPLVKYVLDHDRINVVNRDFHVRQMSATASLSSRGGTRRRKTNRAVVTAIQDIGDEDEDDEDDEDFVAGEEEIARADRMDDKEFDHNVDDAEVDQMDVDDGDLRDEDDDVEMEG